MAMNRLQAAGDLLGHTMKVESKSVGRARHYWTVCSCGYESSPGKSSVFAMNAGIGHAKRIAVRLRQAGEVAVPETPEEVAILDSIVKD